MASLILNIFPVCNNAAEFHKIHPSSSRHSAMQKSEPLNSAMFKSVSGGFTRASFIKNKMIFHFPHNALLWNLSINKFRQPQITFLLLYNFRYSRQIFSVGFFWEDYLLLFERGRFQNCLIWSLEMTFNYNNLHYHVMNRAKILAPATNTKAEMKCLRSQNALDNLVMTNDWG